MIDHPELRSSDPDPLITTTLPALLGLLVEGLPLARLATEVARLAARTLPSGDEVSIALVERDRAITVAFSGSLAATLDERQHGPGFGPALDAARSGSLLRVTTDDSRDYPDFVAVAQRQRVSSVVALALSLGDDVRGAMTLYRRHPSAPIDGHDVAAAAAFASCASKVLALGTRAHLRERRIMNLEAAMHSRAVIEQAKGVLMAQLPRDPDAAFQELVDRSQRTGRKVRDVAADVVTGAAHAGAAVSRRHVAEP